MDNKTSLEKSHSRWSNFKLTCLCILITLSTSSLWVLISFKDHFEFTIFIIVGFISLIILILSLILLTKFKR